MHIPNIHALCGIRAHYPGFRASEDSSCLILLGYHDRHLNYYHGIITKHLYNSEGINIITYAQLQHNQMQQGQSLPEHLSVAVSGGVNPSYRYSVPSHRRKKMSGVTRVILVSDSFTLFSRSDSNALWHE
jgi:hypothetical protein